MTSFNDGIEAAAQELQRAAELLEQSCGGMWSKAAQQRALLKRDALLEMSNRVRALKRPEPSEEMADLSRANSPLPGDMAQTAYPEPEPSEADVERLKQELAALRASVAPLVEAVEALGAMPEGFCFCSQERVGDDSKEHEVECADVRKALAPFQKETSND